MKKILLFCLIFINFFDELSGELKMKAFSITRKFVIVVRERKGLSHDHHCERPNTE